MSDSGLPVVLPAISSCHWYLRIHRDTVITMPLTLANRIGHDTLGKLELAARRRYAEARRLMVHEPLGAIYLFGYSVEIRLKAAYYRVVGLVPATKLGGPRAIAE